MLLKSHQPSNEAQGTGPELVTWLRAPGCASGSRAEAPLHAGWLTSLVAECSPRSALSHPGPHPLLRTLASLSLKLTPSPPLLSSLLHKLYSLIYLLLGLLSTYYASGPTMYPNTNVGLAFHSERRSSCLRGSQYSGGTMGVSADL